MDSLEGLAYLIAQDLPVKIKDIRVTEEYLNKEAINAYHKLYDLSAFHLENGNVRCGIVNNELVLIDGHHRLFINYLHPIKNNDIIKADIYFLEDSMLKIQKKNLKEAEELGLRTIGDMMAKKRIVGNKKWTTYTKI